VQRGTPPEAGITAGSSYNRPEVVKLRTEAMALLRQQSDLLWRNWTTGEALDVAATYAGHEGLFTAESVKTVREARQASGGSAAQALTDFENYLIGEAVARASAPASDELAAAEEQAVLSTSGAPSYRKLDQLLAGEASADQRARLAAAELPVIAKLEPLIRKRRAAVDDALKELGAPTYGAYAASLRGLSLADLAALAERTLAATDALYARTMDKLALEELALPLTKVRRSDLPRLFRTGLTDNSYPGAREPGAVQAVFAALGMPLDQQPGLRLDSAPEPRKNPHPISIPVVVPTDVRLSFKPRPGAEAYRELFFQAARAEEDVHNAQQEWEFQLLGPNSPSESFAFLFEDLVDTAAWLQAWPDVKPDVAASYVRRAAVQRLYLLRRYAGRVEFEALLESGQLTDPPAEGYRRIMSRAFGFKLTADDGRRYLTDQDEFLESADYFLAWILEGHVEAHLAGKFGDRWWMSPEAGASLATVWKNGRRVTLEDVVHWSGSATFDPSLIATSLGRKIATH
jgi:hypothetical protein